MITDDTDRSRRRFVRTGLAGAATLPLAWLAPGASAAELPRLGEADPTAKSRDYVHAATTVDAATRGDAGHVCSSRRFSTAAGEPWGPCALFPGTAAAAGWCRGRLETPGAESEPPAAAVAGGATSPGTTSAAGSLPADPNVDPREVAYYERLAATWWDDGGPFWPLHRLNALRTRYLRDMLSRRLGRDPAGHTPLAGLDVLDVGCGGGILSESVARLGARVHGIDVVARNVEVARRHAGGTGLPVRYETTTAAALAGRGVAYDVVLNMEVVEHVPDVPAFMGDCARLVRPGGTMAVATINRTAASWLCAIVGAEYVLRWLPRGTHRWRRFVTPEEVETHLAAGGLQTWARTGVRVNPLNRRFALTGLMSVNYMLLAQRRGSAPRSAPGS